MPQLPSTMHVSIPPLSSAAQTAESRAEVGHLLSQSLDALEVGQRVVEHVRRLLKTRTAALYQLEPTSGMLITLAVANDFGVATPWHALPLG